MRAYAPKANHISISTRCRTVDQFIGTFRRYATPGSIFIATLIERPRGCETAFSFALADGTPVLRGTGVILEVWKTVDNRYRLPGFELGIRWLSPRSVAVFRQLLIPRRLSSTMKSVVPPPAQSTPLNDDPTIPPPLPEVPCSVATESWSGPTRTATKLPRGDEDTEPVTPVEVRELDSMLACATPLETSTPRAETESIRPSRRWMLHVALVSAAAGVIAVGSDAVPSEATAPSRDRPAAVSELSNDQGPLVVGDGPCRLDVSSTPTGSIVTLDGVRQGESPISIATACGRHRVVISEQHHQPMAAWVTLAVGQAERIEVSLARPIHAVAVTTKPSGAAIYIDGSPAGTTPTMLNILGHVPMTLEIKKAGYQPLIQHLYSTTPLDKVAIQMIKASPGQR